MSSSSKTEPDPPPRELVPDIIVRAEFGNISAMSLCRWDADETLGFPPPVVIRGRKYRFRDQLEAFKARLIETAASGSSTTTARRRLSGRRRPAALEAP